MLFIVQPITVAGRRLRRVGRSGRLEKLVWKQKDNIKSGACCDRDLWIVILRCALMNVNCLGISIKNRWNIDIFLELSR